MAVSALSAVKITLKILISTHISSVDWTLFEFQPFLKFVSQFYGPGTAVTLSRFLWLFLRLCSHHVMSSRREPSIPRSQSPWGRELQCGCPGRCWLEQTRLGGRWTWSAVRVCLHVDVTFSHQRNPEEGQGFLCLIPMVSLSFWPSVKPFW